MLNCYKLENWYNPLKVAPDNDVSASRYIHKFYVFNETGVILKMERGWFSEHHGFSLDIPCVKKIKVDFKCKTAFLISHKEYYDDPTYDVYIPAFALELQKPIYEKHGTWITKTTKTKIDGVEFVEHKYLEHAIWEVWGKMEKEIKELSHYNLTENTSGFDASLKRIRKLRKEYDKAKKDIENYTIEMAIAEGF